MNTDSDTFRKEKVLRKVGGFKHASPQVQPTAKKARPNSHEDDVEWAARFADAGKPPPGSSIDQTTTATRPPLFPASSPDGSERRTHHQTASFSSSTGVGGPTDRAQPPYDASSDGGYSSSGGSGSGRRRHKYKLLPSEKDYNEMAKDLTIHTTNGKIVEHPKRAGCQFRYHQKHPFGLGTITNGEVGKHIIIDNHLSKEYFAKQLAALVAKHQKQGLRIGIAQWKDLKSPQKSAIGVCAGETGANVTQSDYCTDDKGQEFYNKYLRPELIHQYADFFAVGRLKLRKEGKDPNGFSVRGGATDLDYQGDPSFQASVGNLELDSLLDSIVKHGFLDEQVTGPVDHAQILQDYVEGAHGKENWEFLLGKFSSAANVVVKLLEKKTFAMARQAALECVACFNGSVGDIVASASIDVFLRQNRGKYGDLSQREGFMVQMTAEVVRLDVVGGKLHSAFLLREAASAEMRSSTNVNIEETMSRAPDDAVQAVSSATKLCIESNTSIAQTGMESNTSIAQTGMESNTSIAQTGMQLVDQGSARIAQAVQAMDNSSARAEHSFTQLAQVTGGLLTLLGNQQQFAQQQSHVQHHGYLPFSPSQNYGQQQHQYPQLLANSSSIQGTAGPPTSQHPTETSTPGTPGHTCPSPANQQQLQQLGSTTGSHMSYHPGFPSWQYLPSPGQHQQGSNTGPYPSYHPGSPPGQYPPIPGQHQQGSTTGSHTSHHPGYAHLPYPPSLGQHHQSSFALPPGHGTAGLPTSQHPSVSTAPAQTLNQQQQQQQQQASAVGSQDTMGMARHDTATAQTTSTVSIAGAVVPVALSFGSPPVQQNFVHHGELSNQATMQQQSNPPPRSPFLRSTGVANAAGPTVEQPLFVFGNPELQQGGTGSQNGSFMGQQQQPQFSDAATTASQAIGSVANGMNSTDTTMEG